MNLKSLKIKKTDIILISLVLIFAFPFIISFFGMQTYPVVSNSMLHWYSSDPEHMESNFRDIWEDKGYSKSDTNNFPIAGGFEMGDLVITMKSDNIDVGDVVVWRKESGPTTHRLIEKNGTMYGIVADQVPDAVLNTTNEDYIQWADQSEVQEEVILAIPKAGIPVLFISCINDKYCGLSCFFDPVCLQDSLRK